MNKPNRLPWRSFLAVLAAGWLASPAVQATVVRGPMLQGATATNVYVLVECTTNAASPLTVNFGTTAAYGSSASTLSAVVSSASPTTYVHRIKLTGLQPNTLYHYQLSGQSAPATDYSFRTLVNPGTPFRFAWTADYRDSSEAGVHGQISGRILNSHNAPTPPLFDLTGGDYSVTNTYAKWTNQWIVPSELALEAAMPAYFNPGNHDLWRAGTCMRAYSQAPDSTGTNGYYSFDCGDVHVTVENNYTNYTSGSAQWNWAAADVANSLKAWKIAVFHEPAYTYASGGHGSNTNMQNMTAAVFEPGGVKVVLAGHNHFYQHNLVNGIRHLTVGAAGAPLYAVSSNAAYTVKTVSDNCYLIGDVTPTNLHMVVYNNVGTVLDTIDLIKPAAPANLTAAAGTNQATLRWNAVAAATNYTLLYGTTSGGPYPNRQNVVATNNVVTGLVAGTPYYFVVAASDTNGPSAISAQATVTPLAEVFYSLTYAAGAHGAIGGSTNQTVVSGGSGSAVTALADPGYHFANWSDASTANPRIDSNVTQDISVTANYALNAYTLAYAGGGHGSLSGSTNQTVNHGASGSAVTALADPGYHFVNWSDASTANPRTDTNVINNLSVTANFAINTYTLAYAAGAHGSLSGSTNQTVDFGADGSAVTATADMGFLFVNWSDASTANPRTDAAVTHDVSVVANFTLDTNAPPYDQWRANSFTQAERTNPAVSGNAIDIETDGIPNLLEYALVLDPHSPDAPFSSSMVVAGGETKWMLTFQHDPARNDVDLELERSPALQEAVWGPLVRVLGGSPVELLNGTALIQESGGNPSTVEVLLPMDVSAGWIRWRATAK